MNKGNTKREIEILEITKASQEELLTAFNIEKICFQTMLGMSFFKLGEIVYIKKASSKNCTLFTKDDKHFMVSYSLNDLEKTLSKTTFCKTHPNYLVNLAYVKSVIESDNGFLILDNKTHIPISKIHKKELNTKIQNHFYKP